MHLTENRAGSKLAAPAPRPDAQWRHLVDQVLADAELELALGMIEAQGQGLRFRSRHLVRAARLIDVARMIGNFVHAAYGRPACHLLPAVSS